MGASLATAVQVVVLVVVLTGICLGVFGAVGALVLTPSFWDVVVAVVVVAAAPLAVLAYRRLAPRIRWPRGGVVPALGLAFAYLAVDCLALAASFWATAIHVPWRGLPAAYTAGQLASQVPFAPGGTGVVETALDQVVTLNGGSPDRFLPGIFLYRLVGFWALVLAGLVALLVLRVADTRLSARRGRAARSRRRSSRRGRRSRSPRAA
jgi:uncharacterized membrane protein YbhN (UPF0104 family)